MTRTFPIGRIVLISYLVALQAALAAVVVDPDLAVRANARLVPQPASWQPTPFWDEMVAYHLRLDPTAAGAVVFIGDSITQSLHVGAVAPDAVNYGIGSDTIAGVRRRIPLYKTLARARAIVLAIGVNDLATRSSGDAGADYAALLGEVPSGPKLVASAVLPVSASRSQDRFQSNAEIAAFNAAVEQACAARPGCVFVDAGPELRDGSGGLAAAFHTGDGLHLGPAGYRVWAAALKRGLAAAGIDGK